MFFRLKSAKGHTYVQLVENYREEGRPRQRVLLTLGSLDHLRESGHLDALLQSGSRLSESIVILSERDRGGLESSPAVSIGLSLVFERLWEKTGCKAALLSVAENRHFGFSVERAVFFTVLHRLLQSGSDRAALRTFKPDHEIGGTEELQLHHLYRAMAFLGEELPPEEQEGATAFSPRCVKDQVEETLFLRERDLFSGLELVFFDTTSIYFEGQGGESIGQRGHSKDQRPDLVQMVVGVVLDGEGRPICCEMWPGNTTDVTSLLPVVERLRRRFGIVRVCVVADRGMISQETISELEARKLEYILGARMRRQKEVSEEVLTRGGRYHEVTPERGSAKDPSPLKVKEVWVDDHRYVVCRNEEEARKDAHDREAIVAALREALRHGDKSLVGNKGYRRYLRADGGGVFAIDLSRIEEEARYDGKWVLRTNTDLSPADVALTYKRLWAVEEMFRAMKSLLQTRPIWHKCDETIRGHVFCTFLALVLRKALQDRLAAAAVEDEWADVIAGLERLTYVDVDRNGKKVRIRSKSSGATSRVLRAVGVAAPQALVHPPATGTHGRTK
ncbi:MAG: IS1634 family transposase [Thermoanaerobaculia bacterium]|nr:IS1634 family transposase [Thermoanaerobaculia bacterium]